MAGTSAELVDDLSRRVPGRADHADAQQPKKGIAFLGKRIT
jgi:hypothetical protein